MLTWRILVGDVRERLRELPAGSVQTCVTSPPYWGLRDYGTASWDGGDPACDHRHDTEHQKQGASSVRSGRSNVEAQRNDNFRDICGKCGARRIDNQIGLEPTPEAFVAALVEVFREVRRVLRDDGTLWVNLGDSYAANRGYQVPDNKHTFVGNHMGASVPDGLKPKDLCGIPWRVAFALQADGWYLRSDIIWSKPNPMPESVTDRPTKAHEYLFLLSKRASYYYDAEAIVEAVSQSVIERWGSSNPQRKNPSPQGFDVASVSGESCFGTNNGKRNKRSVWHIATQPYPEAHFATFPEALIEPCILAGTSERGCCPTCGAPWVRVVDEGRVVRVREGSDTSGGTALEAAKGRHGTNSIFATGEKRVRDTLGWEPSCACNDGEPVPCTVLDPFNGSGTTGAVAIRHQRNYIGVELNPEYAKLTERRIGAVAPLFAAGVVA